MSMLRVRPIRLSLPQTWLAALLVCTPGLAQQSTVREEVVDRDGHAVGFIDWTEQKVYARADAATATEAAAAARKLLYQVLLVVTVDDATCVGDHVRQFAGLDADLRALVESAQVSQSYPNAPGQTVFVVTPLFGKSGLYATLVKPRPVRVTPALPFASLPEPAAASTPPAAVLGAGAGAARPTPTVAAPSASLPAPKQPSVAVPVRPADVAVTKAQPGAPTATKRQHAQPQPVTLAPAALPALPPKPQRTPLDVPTEGPFTGLLIDARGLNLKRCISPLIVTESGKALYGHFDNMTPAQLQYAHDTGIVSYLPDPAFALKSRAGARPLVVRGLRVDGVYSGNVVISEADGDRVLAADRSAKFLAKMNVAILK